MSFMEAIESLQPMHWIIFAAAAFIAVAVIFNKAIKVLLKLAVIGVVFMFVIYFLVQAGVVEPPHIGN